ncbi:hypothetical protein FJY63_00455 [Candidatus Sumerlaeota bacterium]|nr:hypothetical protein [Candidatus Sumerlaeota bacterium]
MRRIFHEARKVFLSIFFAGMLHFAWVAIFIMSAGKVGALVKGLLWIIAPVVTAAGFTVGLVVGERLLGLTKGPFLRVFLWPLIGCAVGAAAVFWFGPMFIGFGMFLVGTASVVLRSYVRMRR